MINPNAIEAVDMMVSTMDDRAWKQLLGGYENDIDNLLNDLQQEADSIFKTGAGVNAAKEIGLESVGAAYEETMRRESMAYFITSMFDPKYIQLNWHHLEWARIVDTYPTVKKSIKASRGHGKTWFWTDLYSLWKMYRYDPNVPKYNHKLIQHFTQTLDLGSIMLHEMKNMIMDTPELKERLFLSGNTTWKKEEITTKNGCNWRTEGFWSATRGVHPHTIIVDDPFKEDVAFSPTKRAKSLEIFFATIVPMLEPNGDLCLIGTPMHEEDLYGVITRDPERRQEFVCFEYPAVFGDGTLLWEGRWNYEKLMKQRKIQGSLTYAREYMMQVVSSASSLFPYSTLLNSIKGMDRTTYVTNIEATKIPFKAVVAAVDHAKSANVGSDYSVYGVYGVTEDEEMHLLYAHREKGMSFNAQINKMKSINQAFRPEVFVVEANNFQAIYSEQLQDTSIPVIPHTTGSDKKSFTHGLPALAVLHERGKIKYPYGNEAARNMTDTFHAEHNSIVYTKEGKLESASGHDDCTMMEWLAHIGSHYVLHGGGATTFGFLDFGEV